MNYQKIHNCLVMTNLIISLIFIGIIGRVIFEDINSNNNVSALSIIVSQSGGGDFYTISDAIKNASSGDTIHVWSGIYYENIQINKRLIIIGNGSSNTTIDGRRSGDVIKITSDWVNISGLKIINSGPNIVPDCHSGIKLKNVENVTIFDNICDNNTYGILLEGSNHNIIINNSCDNNLAGICFDYSNYNYFANNSAMNNSRHGIYPVRSESNIVINNECKYNTNRGIFIQDSKNISVISNNCSLNYISGITTSGSKNHYIHNNTCNLNKVHGILLFEQSNKNEITSNICNSNEYGILVSGSESNSIRDNICNKNNNTGIYLLYSEKNEIKYNVCNSNTQLGICLGNSEDNNINNNSCTYNFWSIVLVESSLNLIEYNTLLKPNIKIGVGLQFSPFNVLKNNTMTSCGINIYSNNRQDWVTHTIETSNKVNGKPVYYWSSRTGGNIPSNAGQVILANSTNVKANNLNINDTAVSILSGFSSFNNISNNRFLNNCVGICSYSNDNDQIYSNFCNSNLIGIELDYCNKNTISDNNCSNNDMDGIFIQSSSENTIMGNKLFKNTNYGIVVNTSTNNLILNNKISDTNTTGILFFLSSDNNILRNNTISNNKEYGIMINTSYYNQIYHNNFINNSVQAFVFDNAYNQWNNLNFEGNYWSDYMGVDDGSGSAKHAIADDGIGDTEIPHLELDNYPFIKPYGWLHPGEPTLLPPVPDSGYFDSDGNYTVSWFKVRGASYFELQEDIAPTFNDPCIIYPGIDLSYNITRRDNGTYYYRLKVFSEQYESNWSNIVHIKVDWPPNVPKNFNVSVIPCGNTINISWESNGIDTIGYQLYYKSMVNNIWSKLGILSSSECFFNHTDLEDGIPYSYKLQAVDGKNQTSGFTPVITAIPEDTQPPKSPTGLKVMAKTYDSVTIKWAPNTEEDVEGYCIYRGNLSNTSSWGDLIGIIEAGEKLMFTDTGLLELTEYHYKVSAFDEVPNESELSAQISEVTLIGPRKPEINNSLVDFEMYEDTVDNTTINLLKVFSDVNDENLTFWCSGNGHIEIKIDQKSGSVLLIPEQNWCGFELISFCCSDGMFTASEKVTITVLPMNDPPEVPKILSPDNGTTTSDGKRITLKGECFDADLPYGDNLTFYWSSDIVGELGTGETLAGIRLPAGEHQITLSVYDSSGNHSHTSINIMVEKEESSAPALAFNYTSLGILIVIIIFLIILFVILRKKKTDREKVSSAEQDGLKKLHISASSPEATPLSLEIKPKTDTSTAGIFTGKPSTMLSQPEAELKLESLAISQQDLITSAEKYNLNFEPGMIGRNTEIAVLQDYLTKAEENLGTTVFISGEAGVGKTRLVNELMLIARAQGFSVLTTNCKYESLTPFLPIKEALGFGGLDYLLAEGAPRVEAIYLVSHNGLLIKETIRKETKLDPDLFASMLNSVENFVKDSLSILSGAEKEGALNTLGFEEYRIIIESGRSVNLVVLLSGKENEFLINDMKDITSKLDKNYGTLLERWDGNVDKLEGIHCYLEALIISGKYDTSQYREADPKARRNLLFENVSMGLVRAANEKPILLCIEDLQWSDPSTLALIHHIGKNAIESKILIIGTYRPEDLTLTKGLEHPLIESISALEREENFKLIELPRLPIQSTIEILNSMFGKANISKEVNKLIYEETKGNPLFIIELVKYLIEENLIINKQGTWVLSKRREELYLPPKIFNIISLRLSRLEKELRKILDYAAVVGESFSSRILELALKIERLTLLEQLRDLEQRYKLVQSEKDRYEFSHGKIKEVVYAEIPYELKMEYHFIIASAIEQINKDNLDEVLEVLAFHYYASKNKAKAMHYLLKSAGRAKKNYSNQEAIRFYSEALELEDEVDKKLEILNSLAEIYDLIGDYDNSLQTFKTSLGLIKEDRNKLADVNSKIAILYLKKGDYDDSIKHCNAALKLVENKSNKEEALVFETLGHLYHRKGELGKAMRNHQKSLQIREKLQTPKGIGTSYRNIGTIFLEMHEYKNALDYYNKSLKLFEDQSDDSGIQLCLNDIANLHFQKGDYNKAFEFYDRSLKLIEQTGDQSNVSILLLNIGQSLLQIGETKRALANLERSLRISTSNDFQILTACNCWVIAEAYIKNGELQRALNFANQALEIADKLNNREIVGAIKRVFGIIYKLQKAWEKAEKNFHESIEIYREIGNEKELGDTLFELGLMWNVKGDISKAKKSLKEAISIFKRLKLEKDVQKTKLALKNL